MTTLFEVVLHAARALEALQEGSVSVNSSNTTTLTDSQLVVRGFTDDDWFNGGSLFYQSGANRVTRLVTDYSGTTGMITVGIALPETPLLGAGYGVMTRRYPLLVLNGKLEEALA